MSEPLKPEDFGLTEEETRELVEGAQTFMRPEADADDEERNS